MNLSRRQLLKLAAGLLAIPAALLAKRSSRPSGVLHIYGASIPRRVNHWNITDNSVQTEDRERWDRIHVHPMEPRQWEKAKRRARHFEWAWLHDMLYPENAANELKRLHPHLKIIFELGPYEGSIGPSLSLKQLTAPLKIFGKATS